MQDIYSFSFQDIVGDTFHVTHICGAIKLQNAARQWLCLSTGDEAKFEHWLGTNYGHHAVNNYLQAKEEAKNEAASLYEAGVRRLPV